MAEDLGTLARRTADHLARNRTGVVVAAVAGDAVEIRGAGRTGAEGTGAPGADTLFEIGSVTKVFTALTLARLTVEGAVGLDDPLAALLPAGSSVPSRGGEPITLRHLATHTSGLPRLPKGMLLKALLRPTTPDPYADCTAERLLDGLARTRLGAVPGRRFRYSNLGAGLLGLGLARRAGTPYGDLVRQVVCDPLGMADTVVEADGDRAARLAVGHDRRGRPVAPWRLADLAGAGALRGTAADLVSFVRAQYGPAPAGLAEAVALTRAGRHRTGPVSWAHLGWMGHRLHPRQGGHTQIWHNGGTGGFSSFVGFGPEERVAVVVLSNTQRPVDTPAFALLKALQRDPAHAAPATGAAA
ncbi:serine hydrolase domain-containing protein [Streptomyces sp. NPDC097619]|uniref:serine hydrolase domain-containing protein n=1 Tax=Streptomyces sp. NPDC097619 TaxID=3157228 RepID=UPI0033285064